MKKLFNFFRTKLKVKAETIKAISEDARKVGITAMGAGVIGMVVAGDTVTSSEAMVVTWFGVVVWLTGIILTCYDS